MSVNKEQYRVFSVDHFGAQTRVAIYANNDEDRFIGREKGDVVVYVTTGAATCSLHLTPDEAREMARRLSLSADEALPLQMSEAA